MFIKKAVSLFLCLSLILSLTGCAGKRPKIEPVDGWYAAWAAAPSDADLAQVPRAPTLRGTTCRQQIRASIGGEKLKLTFSNEYSSEKLVLDSVHIAQLVGSGSPMIDTSTDTVITFDGKESVTIPAGKTVTSDEISFSFEALDCLAVTTKFGSQTPSYPTCHRDAGCTTWVVEGDHVSDETFSSMELMSSYYYLCRMDTWAPAGTEVVVCFGDSITDGACSTYNGFNSYPDNLAKLMQSNPETKNISVINTGIGGNAFYGGVGDKAAERFVRDALEIPGVYHVIILIGINDLPGAQYDTSEELISEYKDMIKACHERGISIYAGTITPFEGNDIFYSQLHEQIRQKVNEFILDPSSGFDGVVDFSNVLCYLENPSKMQTVYDSGDGLHPNANGYDVMAKAANEMLRETWAKEQK